MNKRDFLRSAGGASLALAMSDVASLFAEVANVPADALAQDEAFWVKVRA